MNEPKIQLKEVKEKIVGMWYDVLTETGYLFRYPPRDEAYAEMLVLQHFKNVPVKFKYRVIVENEDLFLELDGEKYSIIMMDSNSTPVLSFKGADSNLIILRKGYPSLTARSC